MHKIESALFNTCSSLNRMYISFAKKETIFAKRLRRKIE